jgi:hypothetical protein
MKMDIKNYYIGTPLGRYEYVKITVSVVPDRIIEEYNVHDLVHNGYLYVEFRKGMYGLSQAGIFTNLLISRRQAKHGYSPVNHTHGLWMHET